MIKLHRLRLPVLGLLFAATAWHAHAASLVLHEYTGKPYTFFRDTGDPANPNPWLSAAQQRVTGRVTIDTALLPGGTGKNVPFGIYGSGPGPSGGLEGAVVDYSFFDGVFHWEPSSFNVFEQFAFSTDSQGQLSSWDFKIFQNPPDLFIGLGGDIIEHMMFVDAGLIDGVFVRSDMAGTFEVIPIPAALPLMASALVGLGFVARRRRREQTDQAGSGNG